jgi:putative AlgH/UPF0301 family transcriptional regulator
MNNNILLSALLLVMSLICLVPSQALADAINDVVLAGGPKCDDHGVLKYIHNKSSSRSVQATVETSWTYNGEHRTETQVYKLAPGARKSVGCTAWTSSQGIQRFHHKIVGALYY